MKHRFWLVYTVILFANILNGNTVKAQTALTDFSDLGVFPDNNSIATARVNSDPALVEIEQGIIEANKKRHSYGFSVQIFFDSGVDSQKKAEKVVENFKKDYDPNQDVYVFYEAPYFKVRAGNCRTRLEATKLKKSIEDKYPGCFIIECKIQYPKL